MVYLLPKLFTSLATTERMILGLNQMVELLHMRGITAYNEPDAYIPPNSIALYTGILGAETMPMYSVFIPEIKLPFYRPGKESVEDEVEKFKKHKPSWQTALPDKA